MTTTNATVTAIMNLRTGHEMTVGDRVWFRIESSEYKVHKVGTTPDTVESDTLWVERSAEEIADVLAVLDAVKTVR